MRILLLNYEFPPLGGGASNASFEIARALVRKGHAVDVVTSRMHGQLALEDMDGVQVRRVPTRRKGIQDCGLFGAVSYLLGAAAACSGMVRTPRYDVVHYFFGLPTGALSLMVPRLRRIPSIVSLRGSDVPGYDDSAKVLPFLHTALHPVTRVIWNGADRVVANSGGLQRLAQEFLPEKAIGMIPNAIRADLFQPGRERTPGPLRILCVARLVARKGISDLLEALALVGDREVELILQGSGPESDALRVQARELGLEKQVRLAGFCPPHRLPPIYAGADLFVLPSHSESCSMALLEAMASGLPVVATGTGGTPELIEEGLGGMLVPVRSPKHLAEALAKLVADPALRQRMGAHNRQRVEAHYSWDVVTESYLGVYRGAIDESKRRAGA
jgi:glycosyltransferase involved in cell wall biosynthesis